MIRSFLIAFSGLALTACTTTVSVGATEKTPPRTGWNGTIKVGKPYQVAGVWYYPADDKNYEETGIASWYGPDFHGKFTANGELYDMNEMTAAHKTLPMPSFVEVTNLANGRSIVVRVNDRGPFKAGRIIDLSRRSAQILGFDAQGTTQVRVRRVYPEGLPEVAASPPPPQKLASVPIGDDAPPVVEHGTVQSQVLAQVETVPPSVPIPPPEVATGPALFVQVAAVIDQGRAAWLAADLQRFGATSIEALANGFYRVRIGPFLTREAASLILARVQEAGYSQARVLSRPAS